MKPYSSPLSRVLLGFISTLILLGDITAQDPKYSKNPPSKLDQSQNETAILEGDRLAAQGDYHEAVKRYNSAYMGIVSDLRGQSFAADVIPSLQTRSELAVSMKSEIDKEFTPKELDFLDATYHLFGLMKSDQHVGELVTKLLSEEVGGFYDPSTKAMVLVRGNDRKNEPGFLGQLFGATPTFDPDEQKTVLAHELTHALQDQLYDLEAMQRSIESDNDMVMAFQALVEGDATLVMFAESQGDGSDITDMSPRAAQFVFSVIQLALPFAGGDSYRNAPPIFRDSLVFPYFQGMVFNLNVSNGKGFDAIHAVYQSPPLSSEHILHPSKYLQGDDLPLKVDIPNAARLLGENWKHLDGNCFGEFQISIMLGGDIEAKRAAAGWGGDRFEIYRNTESAAIASVWATTWDTEIDARQFSEAVSNYFNGKEISFSLARKKNDVNLVIGEIGADDQIADDLLKQCESATKTPKVFPQKPIPFHKQQSK